jgi:alkylated DNA nucleotide flippase Atl1
MAKTYLTPKEQVLVFLKTIPRGKVTTYKALSKKFGCHPRIILGIMKGNLDPDRNPCHKVLPNDGSLEDYAQGTPERIKRLEQDGIGIKNGKVEDKYIIWEFK